MEGKLEVKFRKKYGELVWRKFYKYVIKKNLEDKEVIWLMAWYMSDDTVRRYIRKLRGVDK